MRLSRSGRLYPQLRRVRNTIVNRRKGLRDVHSTSSIHPTSIVARDVVAEEFVFVGRHCEIAPNVVIGRYTMLASRVAVVGDDHCWREAGIPMQFSGRPAQSTTTVGADVWIGYRVTILRGVTIGRGAVVAAGAVVVDDVPPYEVWGGVPARKIRDRFTTAAERDDHDTMLRGKLLRPTFVEPRQRYDSKPHHRSAGPATGAAPSSGHVRVLTTAHPLDDVRVRSKIVESFVDHGFEVSWVGPEMGLISAVADTTAGDPQIAYHLTGPLRTRADRLLSARRIARRATALPAPDWYYCPDPDAAGVAVRLARNQRARVIFDIHELFHEGLLDRWTRGHDLPWLRELVRRRLASTCRRSDIVVGVNRAVLEPYASAALHKVEVRNCAPAWFGPAAPIERAPHEGTVFMHGKSLGTNGTPVLLEALRRLGDDGAGTRTVVVDLGPEATGSLPDLRRTITDLGIADRVDVREPVPHAAMPAVLASCDVGLIAYGRSLGESSLPNRLFEYMAAGLAVLAPSYAVEIRRIVDDERIGLTVDFENPDEVASALRWFATHPEEIGRMGSRAREAFLARHNWDVEFTTLLTTMDDLTGATS